jgi:4-hydroxybenzoate polyprenyltransferase
MKHILKLIRPEQWTKNLFVFLPVFFGGQLLNISALLSCAAVFVTFSFAASSIYCFNDILDVEADRAHPEKCKRPIVSGAVSKNMAYVMMVACLLLSLGILFFCGGNASYTLVALILFYYAMNFAYCVRFKQYAIIDAVIISIGFVLRVSAGGAASGIRCSEWIIIMTFLLALFLAFAKRHDDAIQYMNTNVFPRKNTGRYNPKFLNQAITVVAAVAIIAYIMYTLSPDVIDYYGSRHVYFTAIFVLTGIIRYLQLTIVDAKSGNPTKILLRDRFIQCCIAGWIISFLAIIYSKAIATAVRAAIS